MKRILVLFVLFLSVTTELSACQRCGLFGRRCIFAQQQVVVQKVVQPVVAPVYQSYVAPYVQSAPAISYATPTYQNPQTLVVNNVYPSPNGNVGQQLSYSTQGNTVYGYQAATQLFQPNPQEMIRQSTEMVKAASQSFNLAMQGANGLMQSSITLQSNLAEPILRSQAAINLLNSAGLNPTITPSQTTTQKLEIEFRDGKIQTNIVPPTPQTQTVSMVHQKCGKCHGIDLATPKGQVNFDAGHKINDRLLVNAIERMKSNDPEKHMPKNETLTPQEYTQILDELLSLRKVEVE